MCRLFGYVGAEPRSVVDMLGAGHFEAFSDLSLVHSDGWGMAWRTPAKTEVVISPGTASVDPYFRQLAGTPLSTAGLVHLRWATDGLAVRRENTHPFTDRGLTLAHNGSISPIERLEAMLSDRARAALRGDTDSERYLQFILDGIDAAHNEPDGVVDAVRTLARAFPTSSLNAIVLSGVALYAVHVNASATPPLDGLRRRLAPGAGLPLGHAQSYFDLAYQADADGVRVVSTGLDTEGWSPLPPDAVLRVDLATREIEVFPLDPSAERTVA